MKIPLLLFAVRGPVTPGARNMKASGDRIAPTPPRASGSSTTCRLSMTVPTSELSDCTTVAPALTSTDSVTAPTANVKLTAVVFATSTSTPVCLEVWNPGAVAATSYLPTCRVGKRYAPPDDSVVEVTPVPTFVAVIFAPSTPAPEASITDPAILP